MPADPNDNVFETPLDLDLNFDSDLNLDLSDPPPRQRSSQTAFRFRFGVRFQNLIHIFSTIEMNEDKLVPS